MVELSGVPFKPETEVFFAHDDGVKKGIVRSVRMIYNKHNVTWLWQVEETTRDGLVFHEVSRNNLATTWEGMEDRLNLIYSYRQCGNPTQKNDEYIF